MTKKSLQHELGKKWPFESPEKEAMLNIVRTGDQFQNRIGKLFRTFGLTGSQHNVLRILARANLDHEVPGYAHGKLMKKTSFSSRMLTRG